MSTATIQDDSEDEFESADEGESVPIPVVKSNVPLPPSDPLISSINKSSPQKTFLPPVTDGWDDWNINDDLSTEKSIKPTKTGLLQQDSTSSLSSSPSKTGGSLSQNGSDEDEQAESSDQQRLQKKKFRKKPLESNLIKDEYTKTYTRISRPVERRDEESSSSTTTKHNVKDAHYVLDRLSAQSPTRTPSWHNPWSNFGSFLSTAKQSVSTLTSTVSEGFSAVIESVEAGLGAPDPQELAEMNRMAFKIKGETSDSEDEPESSNIQTEKDDSITNQDGWLNALSLDKLTNTGMKVVSGSLDVLETVGKKTFDVINEADPDLKGTRRLLGKQNRPTLSEIIREAQNEKEIKSISIKNEPVSFFHLFEKHQGLAHFEALELLSNQSATILHSMSYGNEKLFDEISTYFQINDDDELTLNSLTINNNNEHDIPSLDILSQKFTAYQTQLRATVSVDKLLEVYESAHEFIKEWEWMDTELDQKTLFDEAINTLAILCASIIEYYHKTAQLFIMGCKSLTSFSIDIDLLAIYQKQQQDFSNMLAGIPNLFAKHMKQISNLPATSNNHTNGNERCDIKLKQKLLNQIFIQSSSSQTYASDAYVLLKPIVSQSILYHTSTTR
ncbi:unnamed protein product [Rotaria sp. Silwood2]|nr:unnamed protein product [Rotaria sp. Silwood2]CAF2563053.1 unnamed protein product [Rotaria sp. Silwood2]CAF2753120.1 unnamed protein product [Rotaria sp. Silwood2]CAF2967962.1 unnamed protein product [Rotaria sp. Silwood2]CAF3858339.1 unnamed protein product [Rotaria sp. Silwood2]